MVKVVEDCTKELDFGGVVNAMLKGEISKKMFEVCKPIYHVRRLEIIKSETSSIVAQ